MLRFPQPLRTAAAVVIAAIAGVFVLAVVMSDLGPAESPIERWLLLAAWSAGGGFVCGFVAGCSWPFAAFVAWGPATRSLVDLTTMLRGGAASLDHLYPTLAVLGLALSAAWVGSRASRWRSPAGGEADRP